MIIQIASVRAPKVNGVKKGIFKLLEKFQCSADTVHFETREIESGVDDTPRSIEELMSGARNRAERVFQKKENDEVIAIGAEGGLFRADNRVFLQSWICAYTGSEYFFGSSGAIEIPHALSRSVMEKGADLGIVIDDFAEQTDVRSNQGTFGILTKDSVTREDSFETATMLAAAPIFNRTIYSKKINAELTYR